MELDSVGVVAGVTGAFEGLGIRYVIGGSLASSVHGFPRTTNDADLVADVRLEHVEPLAAALSADFYLDAATAQDAVRSGGSFNLIHFETGFKVDVFVAGGDEFRQAQIARGDTQQVGGVGLLVQSPEDTVLAKLLWYRAGGEVSDRQWRDVLEVITVQGERIDGQYLRNAAARMGVEDLLRKAMSEAGD